MPAPRVFYVANFENSGSGFVDAAAEDLTRLNAGVKKAIANIMEEAAMANSELIDAKQKGDKERVKFFEKQLLYLQDTVIDFVTDIVEDIQGEAGNTELDDFADQLVDELSQGLTMASSMMNDKESAMMKKCRGITSFMADPDHAKSKACRMLWGPDPSGVVPGCLQPNRATPGCEGLSTGFFGKKRSPNCNWGVKACSGKSFGECERIQDRGDNCERVLLAPADVRGRQGRTPTATCRRQSGSRCHCQTLQGGQGIQEGNGPLEGHALWPQEPSRPN